jgi:hypothetical protein
MELPHMTLGTVALISCLVRRSNVGYFLLTISIK